MPSLCTLLLPSEGNEVVPTYFLSPPSAESCFATSVWLEGTSFDVLVSWFEYSLNDDLQRSGTRELFLE